MRPLRERAGDVTTVLIETRTAAQATREATQRYPDLKVVSVTRVTPTGAELRALERSATSVSGEVPIVTVDSVATAVRRSGAA